ncbi:MAG: radical SAM protein [Bacteroidales bacterium]|nr:radical SAM protein [Bacteroidales bacterium]
MKYRLPKAAVLELTYRCNHKCLFCSCPWYAPNSSYPVKTELDINQWKQAISRLYDSGVEVFSISGGEAILKEGFEEILLHIREEGNERGFNNVITLISNGLAMKEEYLHLFKELNVHFSMSLPGYTTFKDHTGVDNAEGVLSWFRKAKEIGLNPTVNVTVTKINYHELFETISLGLINGASNILLNRFLPGGRGLSYMDRLKLNNEQLNGMLDVAEEVLELSNRRGSVGTEFPYCVIKKPGKYKRINIGMKCAAAKMFFVIGPAGEVRTCNHSPKIVGNVFNEDIISDIDYWNDFAQSNYKPQQCKSCEEITNCDCGCREVANILFNNYKEIDPCILDLKK